MKNSVLLKSLVDFIFFAQLISFIGFTIALPFGLANFKVAGTNTKIDTLDFMHWVILGLSLLVYVIFIKGLYFLRKMARNLLSTKRFTDDLILNLKKSGDNFL